VKPSLWIRLNPLMRELLISFAAILLSLLAASVIMVAVGYNPLSAFSALYNGSFGSVTAIANTLSKSVPLLFTGLAFAFAYKSGLFNIGGEGQLYMGALASTAAALAMGGAPRYLVLVVSILAAMLAGGLVGAFTGFVKAKLQINEVIVAIMLNYVATLFASYCLNGPLKAEGMTPQTDRLSEHVLFSKLVPKTQLTSALYLALVAAALIYFFFKKTRMGYNIRAVGENRFAAQASGVQMTLTAVMAMGVSGGIAGLAGMTEVFGKYGRMIDGFSPGFGFTGIAVAMLAGNNPFGIILTAILFGALDAGAMKMSYVAGISANMVMVIQGLVILFVATPNIVRALAGRKGAVSRG
jgi:ABC-type uncharacterized transport system permease subunit